MLDLPNTAPAVPVANERGDVLFLRPDVADGLAATLRAFRERRREEHPDDGTANPDPPDRQAETDHRADGGAE